MGRSMFSLALNVAPFLSETIFYVDDPRRETEVKLFCNLLLYVMLWIVLHFESLRRHLTIFRNVVYAPVLVQWCWSRIHVDWFCPQYLYWILFDD